jgi:glycosyltransferase involved in cell wall biosynthesis
VKIVHLPSWYPSSNNLIEGIFNKRLIYAINEFDKNQHVIITWQHNKIASLRNPLAFLINLYKSFLPAKVFVEENITIVQINYFISNEYFFGSNNNRLINKIDKVIIQLDLLDSTTILHAHVVYPGGQIAQKLSVKYNIPYLITEHMGPFPFENLKVDLLDKVITPISSANYVIAVSKFLANQIKNIVDVKLEVIPNVLKNIDNDLRLSTNKYNCFRFIVISRITIDKGMEVLVSAIELLASIRTDFCVHIYGEGSSKIDLIVLLKQKNLSQFVCWFDILIPDNVQTTIATYNCLISPSLYESFGVTLIEALSVGVPIISSDSGGPRDIVSDINGLLVSANDSYALSNAMNTIINNYHLFDKNKIIDDCRNRYSNIVVSQKYSKVYKRILEDQTCVV